MLTIPHNIKNNSEQNAFKVKLAITEFHKVQKQNLFKDLYMKIKVLNVLKELVLKT